MRGVLLTQDASLIEPYLLPLDESISQKRVGLRDGGACGGRLGEGVEHDEVMDGAVIAGGGNCDARNSELASIGLAFIAQHIILVRDDECRWQTLQQAVPNSMNLDRQRF
jgi:hypothetical protein